MLTGLLFVATSFAKAQPKPAIIIAKSYSPAITPDTTVKGKARLKKTAKANRYA